jgi:FkbM family methyltransferase
VDIGGNIADSAIYFALRGANKIVCIEPLPKNCELARKNILFNNFSHKISAVLAGCPKNSREINIDPSYSNGAFSTLKDSM